MSREQQCSGGFCTGCVFQTNLKRWSETALHVDRERVQFFERRLGYLLQGEVTPEVNQTIVDIRAELEGIAAHTKMVWRQCSKDLWLQEGDRNTWFFHRRASQRYRTNLITKIRNSEGAWVVLEEGIKDCILSHFGEVYHSNRPQAADISRGMAHLQPVVDASMGEELLQPYTAPEVTKALFQMAPLKSLGIDDMSPIFFQKFWHIVGKDVTSCVLNLLNSCIMPQGLNSTHLVLIPKCKNPEYLAQFRPISLCNVIYKIASKTIANRLKLLLDKIISPAQSSFMPGRLISDNIMLAFELNHFLNMKSRGAQGWMALKLDVSKAYDKASHASSQAIRDILETYRDALGQEISFSKSSVAFSSNTREELGNLIAADLTIQRENKMELYLGLPSRIARSKRDLFSTIRIAFGVKSQDGTKSLFHKPVRKCSSKLFFKPSVVCHGMLSITADSVEGNPRDDFSFLVEQPRKAQNSLGSLR
ncbi:UNVERIFIED_CONTAM: hypothetical protein Sradi_1893300 [Sesamum radiatum]|uniref:Reverse transcriptase domain-containing protein n=1 Tax=Sesamum radiatum TaxID=300843 RepID=A0AAW2TYG6_SESRA